MLRNVEKVMSMLLSFERHIYNSNNVMGDYPLVTFKVSENFTVTDIEKNQTYQFLCTCLKYKSGQEWTDIVAQLELNNY